MKPPIKLTFNTPMICLFAMGALTLPLRAANPPVSNASATPPKSVFSFPSSPKDGRDPFFPNSLRPYEEAPSVNSTGVSSLVLKGFSGTGTHRLVIINNHTFAEGDEEDVTTPAGRIHVRCIAIRGNTVFVEANGQSVQLTFQESQ